MLLAKCSLRETAGLPIGNPLRPEFVFSHQNSPVIENAQENSEVHRKILDVCKLMLTAEKLVLYTEDVFTKHLFII